jgi:hypothetical protein
MVNSYASPAAARAEDPTRMRLEAAFQPLPELNRPLEADHSAQTPTSTRKIFTRNFPCSRPLFARSPSQAMQIFGKIGLRGIADRANQATRTENKGLSPLARLKLSLANFPQTKHSSRVRAILRAWEDL